MSEYKMPPNVLVDAPFVSIHANGHGHLLGHANVLIRTEVLLPPKGLFWLDFGPLPVGCTGSNTHTHALANTHRSVVRTLPRFPRRVSLILIRGGHNQNLLYFPSSHQVQRQKYSRYKSRYTWCKTGWVFSVLWKRLNATLI